MARKKQSVDPLPLHERASLSVVECAVLSGLTKTLITEAIACGLLRSAKIGKRRIVRRAELERFIAQGERGPLNVRRAYRREMVRREVNS